MARETSDFNQTPAANRIHISIFGNRNAGKSSLINALTGQSLAIVSPVEGTTTDPVSKTMEILPLGPVVITDTPGIDDVGPVGEMRVEKALEVLRKTDIALLVVDISKGLTEEDRTLIAKFQQKKTPFIVVYNKDDLKEAAEEASTMTEATKATEANEATEVASSSAFSFPSVRVSAKTKSGIDNLKEKLAALMKDSEKKKTIISHKLKPSDTVILVTPIDGSAPKGRLILPQVQTIRDLLDGHAITIVVQLPQLESALSNLNTPPALVITDSQVFGKVKSIVPEEIPLTSFSVLFANYKGILDTAVAGAHHLQSLKDGDKVLISEGCTHHRQCEDIGTVKLPRWIEEYTGKKPDFHFTSGGQFPQEDQLKEYSLVVHCGGCMLNEKEMTWRMNTAGELKIPFTNYGTLIAEINGILKRSLEIIYEK